jgi:hypothetical protein
MMRTKLVTVNEQGRRIGESHPRARLTDEEVDLIRDLVESLVSEGKKKKEAYAIAAEKFDVSPHTVLSIAYCRRRAHTIAGTKRVAITQRDIDRVAGGEDFLN